MEQARLYPVGIQSFEAIRNSECVYVDKTEYVYRMTRVPGTAMFLSRPRRFGKSLLCDTLKHYFMGHRELFDGLAIAQLEKEWTVYPVLHFDMSMCKKDTPEAVGVSLGTLLRENEQIYGRCPDSDDYGDRLRYIIKQAHQATGQQVVLIFDEYDSPVLNVIDDAEKRDAIRSIFNEFYGPVKSMYNHIRFTFITGITKFSQMSIFSSINNLNNISLDAAYEGICGITADELTTVFAPDIALLATKLKISPEETLQRLQERYDGYRFGPGLTEVYNPFSLVNAFDKMNLSNYWFDSATPSALIKILKSYPFLVKNIGRTEALADMFDQPFNAIDSALPLLVQSGYMTIKDYDPEYELYTLDIPNGEVRDGLYKTLMYYYLTPSADATNGMLLAVLRALRNDDIDGILTAVQSYLLTLPYNLSNKTEADFETILKVLFDGIGATCDCEVRNAVGRCDVVFKSAKTIYVLELKIIGRGTVDEALAQIDRKHYLIPYWDDPRTKVKVGVTVDPESRTIAEWKVVR